jgi:hypothetical protein
MTPAELAWPSRWRAVRPNAVYNHAYGLEGAWRANADEWGFPLEDAEQDVELDGGEWFKARTFHKIGLVIWRPEGPEVIGWP